MCGLSDFSKKGTHVFDTRKVPLVFICCIKSKRFIEVFNVGVKEIALALLMHMSIPENSSTVF